MQCDHQTPTSGVISVLTHIDTLPRSQIELTATDGDAQRIAQQRSLDVRGHVIWPFVRVEIILLQGDLVEIIGVPSGVGRGLKKLPDFGRNIKMMVFRDDALFLKLV